MAASVTEGSNSVALTYDTEHARVKQVTTGTGAGTTYYLNDPVTGTMEEELLSGSTTTWHDYIMADGRMVAERFCTGAAPCTGSPTLEYFVPDHLGSISVITDAGGNVLERLNFDSWGRRRGIDGSAAACGSITSSTTRGFTGQEMMDGVCLINFNARLYDPALGRFASADSEVPDPFDLQSLNRYSYVNDNPLSETDPTGQGSPYGCICFAVGLDPALAISELSSSFDFLGQIPGFSWSNSIQSGLTSQVGAAPSGVTQQSLQDLPAGTIIGTQPGVTVFVDPNSRTGFSALVDNNTELGRQIAEINADGGTAKFDGPVDAPSYAEGDIGTGTGVSGMPTTTINSGNDFETVVVTASRTGTSVTDANCNNCQELAANQPGRNSLVHYNNNPSPYTATSKFRSWFEKSPTESAIATAIILAFSGDKALYREWLPGDWLELPGGAKAQYDIYNVPGGPGMEPYGRLAHDPSSNRFFYSPYHYQARQDVPAAWVEFDYPVMGKTFE